MGNYRLSELCDRQAEAIKTLTAERDRLAAEVERLRTALLAIMGAQRLACSGRQCPGRAYLDAPINLCAATLGATEVGDGTGQVSAR